MTSARRAARRPCPASRGLARKSITSMRGRFTYRRTSLPLHHRVARLAYGVALIGKTVTTGASQAMASSCGTAGGEADGPGHSAGETDTGGDGPCSMDIPRCCANESAGKPVVAMALPFSDVLTVTCLSQKGRRQPATEHCI